MEKTTQIHLLNFDLANRINNGDVEINSLKAAGYCGNENDHTWAIDSPDNDLSFLYTSKFEYQNDIEKLQLNSDFAEPEPETIDLFEVTEQLPEEVQTVLANCEWFEPTYENCEELLKLLNPHGYTFDYYLNAEPYNLRKL